MIDGNIGQRKIKTLIKSVDEASHQYMRLDHDLNGVMSNELLIRVCPSTEVHRRSRTDVRLDACGGDGLQVGSFPFSHLTAASSLNKH